MVPKIRGTRVVLDIHDVVPELYAGKFGVRDNSRIIRILLLVERTSCRFANHVIVANHLWYDRLTQRSVPHDRCTTILNCPDLALFRPYLRERAGSDGRFVFLYPGTLNHHQGLDIAVAAFAEASPHMPRAEFHIYGDGPDRDALQRQVRNLRLEDRVKVMDRVPLHDVPRLMSSADAGVVPKRADGFGNEAFSTKILEFMACGVPAIVSKTKVDSYYFTDQVVRFFTPGDSADLARAMIAVYQQRDSHGTWVSAASDFVRHNAWQGHSSDYTSIVDRLADNRGDVAHQAGAER
jgi:glycosyltransferase involved in cell wall biosynthesis